MANTLFCKLLHPGLFPHLNRYFDSVNDLRILAMVCKASYQVIVEQQSFTCLTLDCDSLKICKFLYYFNRKHQETPGQLQKIVCNFRWWSSQTWRYELIRLIRRQKSLRVLQWPYVHFDTDQEWGLFRYMLKQLTEIESLDLTGIKVNEPHLTALANCFSSLAELRVLNLNFVEPDILGVLVSGLTNHPTLQRIKVGSISLDLYSAITTTVDPKVQIDFLDLKRVPLSDTNYQHQLNAISQYPFTSLKLLVSFGNPLSPPNWNAVISTLELFPTLTDLDIDLEQTFDTSMIDQLIRLTQLQSLRFVGNNVNKDIELTALTSLASLTQLMKLDLYFNTIGPHLEAFWSSVVKMTRLRHLSFRMGRITPTHTPYLVKIIESLPQLETFDLESNSLSDESGIALHQARKSRPLVIKAEGTGMSRDIWKLLALDF